MNKAFLDQAGPIPTCGRGSAGPVAGRCAWRWQLTLQAPRCQEGRTELRRNRRCARARATGSLLPTLAAESGVESKVQPGAIQRCVGFDSFATGTVCRRIKPFQPLCTRGLANLSTSLGLRARGDAGQENLGVSGESWLEHIGLHVVVCSRVCQRTAEEGVPSESLASPVLRRTQTGIAMDCCDVVSRTVPISEVHALPRSILCLHCDRDPHRARALFHHLRRI